MSAPTPVESADPGRNTSEIVSATAAEATVKMDQQDAKCFWNDTEFSKGDRVIADGTCYECSFGRWVAVED